jgi:hypothetical protein
MMDGACSLNKKDYEKLNIINRYLSQKNNKRGDILYNLAGITNNVA